MIRKYSQKPFEIVMRKLADMHVDLRHTDPKMLAIAIRHTANQCGCAVVMPNTKNPTITAEDIVLGRKYINEAASRYNTSFKPLMMIKMESTCSPDMIREAKVLKAVGTKSYPSEEILEKPPKNLKECWEEQSANGMISSWHCEMPNSFVMDSEKDFLPFIVKLAKNYPKMKIVLEHITTKEAVELVMNQNPGNIAATITYHHLKITLDDVLKNKLQPHYYCKPIPKTLKDRMALCMAAFSGNPHFFFGSDSTPHFKENKEGPSGCAGVFTAPILAQGLVDLFDTALKLEKLEDFACNFGPQFYNVPPPQGELRLEKTSFIPNESYNDVVTFSLDEKIQWRLKEN